MRLPDCSLRYYTVYKKRVYIEEGSLDLLKAFHFTDFYVTYWVKL